MIGFLRSLRGRLSWRELVISLLLGVLVFGEAMRGGLWSSFSLDVIAIKTKKSTTGGPTGNASHVAKVLASNRNSTLAKGPNYNPYWLVVSPQLRLAVTIVPKVMCSSIRTALNTLECGSREKRCAEARQNHTLASMNLDDKNNWTRVAFIRDPFERALSAYENSDTNPYIYIHHCHNTTDCTFAEWVQELAKNKKSSSTNEHFLPQSQILQLSEMRYNYLFRLSSAADQLFFWNQLLQRNHSLHVNTAASSSNVSSLGQFFTAETLQLLSQVYAEDLDLWAQMLRDGTPRPAQEERTVYDYFVTTITEHKL